MQPGRAVPRLVVSVPERVPVSLTHTKPVVGSSKSKSPAAHPARTATGASAGKKKPGSRPWDKSAKPHSANTTVVESQPTSIIVPTINNYVNITTIAPSVPSFVTIPSKPHQAYLISPLVHEHKVTSGGNQRKAGKNVRIGMKSGELRQSQKPAVPSKSQGHSKRASLDSSIGDLLAKSKPVSLAGVKVKDVAAGRTETRRQARVVVTKYAFYSKAGKTPENPSKQNQDSFLVSPKILGSYSQHLFGVADGHGQFGKEVSSTVKLVYPGTAGLPVTH